MNPVLLGIMIGCGILLAIAIVNAICVEIRTRRKKAATRESNAEAIAIGARITAEFVKAAKPTPIEYCYQCPDCKQPVRMGSIGHQHENGEWIYTEDIRRFYQGQRWERTK